MGDIGVEHFTRRVLPGACKLRAFLKRHGITFTDAGAALGVSRITVHHWAQGLKRPVGRNPGNIEIWTSGEIPAADWDDPEESSVEVLPYRPPADAGPPAPESGPSVASCASPDASPAVTPPRDSDAA